MAAFRPPAGYPLMIAIVLLTLATAIIHLSFGVPLFVLNGIGYIGLMVLMYLPPPKFWPLQQIVRFVLIAYTALTVVLYVMGGPPFDALGLATKAIEVLLIAALAVEATRARRPAPAA